MSRSDTDIRRDWSTHPHSVTVSLTMPEPTDTDRADAQTRLLGAGAYRASWSPWVGERARGGTYFVTAHGTPGLVELARRDGSVVQVTGGTLARLVARSLPFAAAGGAALASVTLIVCSSAAPHPLTGSTTASDFQAAMSALGGPSVVHATTTTNTNITQYAAPATSPTILSMIVLPTSGEWVTVPAPDEVIADRDSSFDVAAAATRRGLDEWLRNGSSREPVTAAAHARLLDLLDRRREKSGRVAALDVLDAAPRVVEVFELLGLTDVIAGFDGVETHVRGAVLADLVEVVALISTGDVQKAVNFAARMSRAIRLLAGRAITGAILADYDVDPAVHARWYRVLGMLVADVSSGRGGEQWAGLLDAGLHAAEQADVDGGARQVALNRAIGILGTAYLASGPLEAQRLARELGGGGV